MADGAVLEACGGVGGGGRFRWLSGAAAKTDESRFPLKNIGGKLVRRGIEAECIKKVEPVRESLWDLLPTIFYTSQPVEECPN